MKSNKIVILAGIVIMGFVLSQVNSDELTAGEIFSMMQKQSSNVNPVYLEKINNATSEISDKLAPTDKKELSILAFGDIMMGRYVRVLMDEKGHNYPFENLGEIKNIFSENEDIVFANLEGPIKGDGIRSHTSMTFGFPDYVGDLLAEKGISLVSLANNHTLNMGEEGVNSTMEILKDKGVGYCGAPVGISENTAYYGATNNDSGKIKYAFLCFHSAVSNLNLEEVYKLIDEARPNVDFLIVSMHWGSEYKNTPNQKTQVAPGRAFIDHGADLVIGHHPHVVQPFEIYKNRFIFYSLGNFIFDQYWSAETQKQLSVGIILEKNSDGEFFTSVELFPMKSEKSQPRLLTKEEYDRWAEEFIGYGNFTDEEKTEIQAGRILHP